jgi:hypothetical protein
MDLFPTAGNTATATSGIGDIAIAFGDGSDASATGGILDSALALDGGIATVETSANFDSATAVDTANSLDPADGDVAVVGSDNPSVGGDFDLASVLGAGSTAEAGAFPGTATAGDFDLAAVFGDMLHATATGSNYLVDILPSL